MKKILIIEDEEALVEILRDEFTASHFDVDVAHDGEEGLEKIRSIQPDLVLLDLLLPKKDGFEVLEELHADRELRTIPVIVLSNLGQDDDIKRTIKLGAVDYFVKTQHPIKEIIQKVNKYLIQAKA